MKLWMPPTRRKTSGPGRSSRWYVLASRMGAPRDVSSSGVSAVTVARVPTGMKTGVSTRPRAVVRTPLRARDAGSRSFSVKVSAMEGRR